MVGADELLLLVHVVRLSGAPQGQVLLVLGAGGAGRPHLSRASWTRQLRGQGHADVGSVLGSNQRLQRGTVRAFQLTHLALYM